MGGEVSMIEVCCSADVERGLIWWCGVRGWDGYGGGGGLLEGMVRVRVVTPREWVVRVVWIGWSGIVGGKLKRDLSSRTEATMFEGKW